MKTFLLFNVCLLLVSAQAESQSIVTSSDRQSITLSAYASNASDQARPAEKPDDSLDEIKRDLASLRRDVERGEYKPPMTNPSDPAVTVPVTPLPPVVTAIMPSVPKRKRRYVAMFTGPSCTHCRVWDDRHGRKLKSRGYHVKKIDMSKQENVRFFSNVSSLPAFAIYNYDTGKAESQLMVGSVDADVLAGLIGEPTEPVEKSSVVRSTETSGRFVKYGNTTYDMETWQKMCNLRNCGMCNYLSNTQAQYFRNKSQNRLTQIEEPSSQSSSPVDVVDEAIAIAKLTASDVVAELGSGSGLPAIQMVRQSGCRVIGVELDPIKVAESRANIEAAGLSDRITIIQGDVKDFDPAEHGVTVVYAYLYPELLNQIKPALSAGRIAICPGHKADGLDMQLVGQCWVRQSGRYQTASVSVPSSIYDGVRGSSHESRESLISHLLTSPVHAGRWSASRLQQMTDEQLDAAHNQDHTR